MTSTVLICGDSDCVAAGEYQEAHFSSQLKTVLPDANIINLASNSANNALIDLQVRQGVANFSPDYVILSFSNVSEIECNLSILKDSAAYLNSINPTGTELEKQINQSNASKFITNNTPGTTATARALIETYLSRYVNLDFIKLKNYFNVVSTLQFLTAKGIPYRFGLGGFKPIYIHEMPDILSANFVTDELGEFLEHALEVDLGDHNPPAIEFYTRVHRALAMECAIKLGIL